MPKLNSRQKGKRGEIELSHFLTERGWPAKRGQQHKGGDDSPDVICNRLSDLSLQVECKRVEALNLYKALEQAQEDAGPFQDGVVFHRRNNKPWVAIIDAEAFLRILAKAEEV